MRWSTRSVARSAAALLAFILCVRTASAQTVTVAHNVNLRPEQSIAYPANRLLTPAEPPLELLEPHAMDGYYHVQTQAGEEGYVWSRSVHVTVTAPASPAALTAAGGGPIVLGPGVPGSNSMQGCGDGRWKHVYHPTRLLVKNDCATVTARSWTRPLINRATPRMAPATNPTVITTAG